VVLQAVVVPAASRHGAVFASHGTNFIEHWQCRGTSLIDSREIVPVDEAGRRHWRSVAE